MKGLHKRSYSGWEPIDENAQKIFRRYKVGETALLENTIKRNVAFHGKYFKVLELTFQNQDLTNDSNTFRKIVQIHAGFWHWIKLIDGTSVKESDSISFENMDDLKFEDLYNKVFDVCLHILGLKSEELELELLKFS